MMTKCNTCSAGITFCQVQVVLNIYGTFIDVHTKKNFYHDGTVVSAFSIDVILHK